MRERWRIGIVAMLGFTALTVLAVSQWNTEGYGQGRARLIVLLYPVVMACVLRSLIRRSRRDG